LTRIREFHIRAYGEADRDAVVGLWTACELVVPWNVPEEDIATKLAYQPELFFVAERGVEVVGSVMAGYEGHRGQINYLAVRPDLQGGGLGRELMEHAEASLRALGAPKINLQVRARNRAVIEFYESLGYAVDDTVNLGKRLDGK
jgi:ribosomal protein S18 acetylase RimI-like enzyme